MTLEIFHVRVNNKTGEVVPMWGHQRLMIELAQNGSVVCLDTENNGDVVVALHDGKLVKVNVN